MHGFSTLRCSVGLEDVEDLRDGFAAVLDAAAAAVTPSNAAGVSGQAALATSRP